MNISKTIAHIALSAGLFGLLSTQAGAVSLGDFNVADSASVANEELSLNGAGIRSKAYFKIYLAALYLQKKEATVGEVLGLNGPKRLQITLLHGVSGRAISESLLEGLEKNFSDGEKEYFTSQIAAINDMFHTVEAFNPQDVITLDWLPGSGTVARVNGKALHAPIPGESFYKALLKIWLGEHPVTGDLKQQLLGTQAS